VSGSAIALSAFWRSTNSSTATALTLARVLQRLGRGENPLRDFVPASAHDSSRNGWRNRRQRCHILHDRPNHLAQRWITYRRRYALGGLF
jgi:hypothetical protein